MAHHPQHQHGAGNSAEYRPGGSEGQFFGQVGGKLFVWLLLDSRVVD